MKTRYNLALAIPVFAVTLGLGSTSCTGAEAPPASAGFWIALQDDDTSPENCGLDTQRRTMPVNDAAIAVAVTKFAQPEEIEALELMRDGKDGATVECKIKELAVGSYEVEAEFSTGAYNFELSGSTGGVTSAGFKSPQTAGEFVRTSACTLETALAVEGGGEAIVIFNCPGATNQATPDRVCLANGAFYARDCKN